MVRAQRTHLFSQILELRQVSEHVLHVVERDGAGSAGPKR